MNYTLIYEILSLTMFAASAALVMANSFVEKRGSKLRCFIFLLIPKLIQQYAQYYNTNVEQTVLTTVLFSAATLVFDFFLFFVVFESSFQEIIVTIVSCELSSLPMALYKNFISEKFTTEGTGRILIADFKTLLLTLSGYIVVVSLAVIIVILLGKLLGKIKYETKLFSILGKIGVCGFIAMELFTIIDDGMLFFKSKEYLFRYTWINLVWIALFITMYIINDYFTKKKLRREIEILNEEKTRQFEYYNLVKTHNEEIRKIRHDIKGHISAISSLVEKKEYERVEEYVTTLDENFSKIKRVAFTGNITADTVICDIKEKCDKDNIKFTPKGLLPEKAGIDDVSLTCIMTNVLSNAYEACKRVEKGEKFIDLDIHTAGGCIIIKCTNSKNPAEKVNSKNIKTLKTEPGHGYGIKIINDIVKENEGTLEVEDKTDIFEIKILLTGAEQKGL